MSVILWLFGFFLVCLFASAAAARKLRHGSGEQFVLSRTLGGLVSGLSSGATANSGFIVIGAVGMGYSLGVSSLLYPLAWLLGDIIFWSLCARRVYGATEEKRSLSVPELIANGTAFRLARRLSAAIIAVFLTVYLVGQMSSAAKALDGQVEASPAVIIFVFAFLVAVYTAIGGFLSSVWTDVVQAVAMLTLVAGVLVWLALEVGGVRTVYSELYAVDPSLVDLTGSLSSLPTAVGFVAFAFLAFGFGLSQPQVTTRLMGLKSRTTLLVAAITHISFVQVTWCGMCVVGVCLRLVLPSVVDPETALAVLATERLGMFGPAVIVGMFAAIVSSADSLMLGASTAVTWDFAGNATGDKQSISRHRIAVGGIASVAAIAAVFWDESVFAISVFAASGLAATVGIGVFAAAFRVRRSGLSLCAAMGLGLIVCIVWRFAASNLYSLDTILGFASGVVTLFVLRPRGSYDVQSLEQPNSAGPPG